MIGFLNTPALKIMLSQPTYYVSVLSPSFDLYQFPLDLSQSTCHFFWQFPSHGCLMSCNFDIDGFMLQLFEKPFS